MGDHLRARPPLATTLCEEVQHKHQLASRYGSVSATRQSCFGARREFVPPRCRVEPVAA
jgi:hypothetical protein